MGSGWAGEVCCLGAFWGQLGTPRSASLRPTFQQPWIPPPSGNGDLDVQHIGSGSLGMKRGPWHPRPPGIPHRDGFACSVICVFLLKGKCQERLWWGLCSCDLSREQRFNPVQSVLGKPPHPLPHLGWHSPGHSSGPSWLFSSFKV